MSQTPKKLQIKELAPADEFHPGGMICKIIDNDGTTVLKEWWENYRPAAILHCRNWLKMKYEGNVDFSLYEEMFKPIERIENADTGTVGPTLVETSPSDIPIIQGSVDTSGSNFSNPG